MVTFLKIWAVSLYEPPRNTMVPPADATDNARLMVRRGAAWLPDAESLPVGETKTAPDGLA